MSGLQYEYCQRRFNAGLENWREPDKRGLHLRKPVEIIHTIAAESAANGGTVGADSGMEKAAPGDACNTPKSLTTSLLRRLAANAR